MTTDFLGQSSKASEDLELLKAEREALSRRQGERGGELERLRAEVDKAEQREKDEEDELKKLRDYQSQIKDMQIKRMQVLARYTSVKFLPLISHSIAGIGKNADHDEGRGEATTGA